MDRIKNWVVVMFENRSFDVLLGHLPHIPPEDGLIGRHVELPYPGGTVTVHPSTNFTDPIPDPGEEYESVNVQIFGAFMPESNAGQAPYGIFPDRMSAPFNVPADTSNPSMDGFALDFYYSAQWQTKRTMTDAEMQSIGAMFTPETAPVINTLAREYAVFTRWFCDAPTCTFPNRTFFHAGTSGGRLTNDITYNYGFDMDVPNLFERASAAGVTWRCYYPEDQKVPLTAINLGGARHLRLWDTHAEHMSHFFDDAKAGTLPAYSFIEPSMLVGQLTDYHPPFDVRAGEQLLASIYEAVRTSPQWEQTALVIMFDEHGGCYDHVPPPSAVPPGGHKGRDDFGFMYDRLGVRIPTIVVSPYTERETVIRDVHTNTSMTRTLRESLGLGDAFTSRDAAATPIDAAFNRTEPRSDAPTVTALPFISGQPNPGAQQPTPDDIVNDLMFVKEVERRDAAFVSQLGQATLRNCARLIGHDPEQMASHDAHSARAWLEEHFVRDGRFHAPEVPPSP